MVEKTQTEVSRTMKLGVVTCWVVTMGVGFLNLVLFREVGLAAIAIAGGAPQLAALLDKVIFFLFGVGGLAIIILSEAYAIHRRWIASNPEMYGEFFRLRTRLGAFISGDQYVDALRWRRMLTASLVDAMADVELVLTANQNGPAETFENSQQDYHFFGKSSLTMPANISGQPALTIRGGFAENGLPLGIQLIGRSFADADLLRVGHQFEQARPDLHSWPTL